ncbi:hypothetical protein QA644_10655 [Rhizobium sp. CC1099]|uniref:hypothetical protein n=1 Tax=Rhizobium sp. CC1099 TaxID=3039160 RepID=UPI0024B24747|nr:hypothetical protein [Rhizobium sp. CC1099]WFU89456.1 hypothetical protein QA644_10655 [Rhizobium sp. CC1099]
MGRKALIFIILMGLAGCQTVEKRATRAAQAKGQTAASVDFPPLPEACTAHVERVKAKVGEKFRWINQRWEITADNRDRQADDCRAWGRDMQTRYGAR